MSRITAGPGDEATWGPCTGHPNDPRTEDSNVFLVNGVEYDLDDLSANEIAELLEAGEKVVEAAGIDWYGLIDLAGDYIKSTLK
jgi:hypothetical protein